MNIGPDPKPGDDTVVEPDTEETEGEDEIDDPDAYEDEEEEEGAGGKAAA